MNQRVPAESEVPFGASGYGPLLSDPLRAVVIDALEAAGREPDPARESSGWIPFRCIRHVDEDPAARLGMFKWKCWSCGAEGTLRELAEELGVGLSKADWSRWQREFAPRLKEEQAKRDQARAKARDRLHSRVEALWLSSALKLEAQGRWYLAEHRGIDPDFAEAYGVRSYPAGIWPDCGIPILAPIRRRGGLILPIFVEQEAPPVSLRVRASLPSRWTKRPAHIPSKTWRGACPDRYWAPKGHNGSLLFNEKELRSGPIERLYVAEGEIDALALLKCGHRAIGLTGMNAGWKRLRTYLKHRDDIDAVVLVPDDEQRAILKFCHEADELAAVSSATIRVRRPLAGDLDEALRNAGA